MVEITKNKHFYAAFTNMAQHNFFMTLNHIAKVVGISAKGKFEEIAQSVIDNLNSSQFQNEKCMKLIELLRKHLPFLVPMSDGVIASGKVLNEKDAFHFVLSKINRVLIFYRNYTTHYNPDEDDNIKNLNLDERSLVPLLKDLFKASVRTIQQRFGYDEREISFIKNKEMGKENYKYALYKKELLSSRDAKPSSVFSLRGLVLFVALMLEKKYISEMLDKIDVFFTPSDKRSTKRQSIIFESIAAYRIILPRTRYDSETNSTALALDMLNELQRCPRELFDVLSFEDQELFRGGIDGGDELNTMLMIRHRDRFPELALRYIDDRQLFRDIRFQVSLGAYRFAFYNKRCIGSSQADDNLRVRSLQKKLHGFGRLDEIEKLRKEQWKDLIVEFDDVAPDTPNTTPYITDHHASYLIANNRIGLYWKAGRDEPLPGLPVLSSTPKAHDLREKKKSGETIVKLTAPKCFLSTYELPALVFYTMLLDKLDESTKKSLQLSSTEKIIKQWVQNFNGFVRGLINNEIPANEVRAKAAALGIDFDHQIPKKLIDFVDGRQCDWSAVTEQKLRERLNEHIEQTEYLLNRIKRDLEAVGDKRNRRGTKKFVEIKPGRLGAWLAHDIIALQPKPQEGNNKLTGLNFQILQSALSMFDPENIKRVLVSAHLIMHDDAHPFLMTVINKKPSSTVEFYKQYLKTKLLWLQAISTQNLTQFGFITRGVSKWADRDDAFYTKLMNQYLEHPVELPRGLFMPAIAKILGHLHGEQFAQGDRREQANAAFLIAKWFKHEHKDDSQEFYTQPQDTFKRYYTFFKSIHQFKDATLDYGKTVHEIEDILANDNSIRTLCGKEQNVLFVDQTTINKALEEVEKKLAKALAKNPDIDVEQRIQHIFASSVNLNSLSEPVREHLIGLALSKHQIAADPAPSKPLLLDGYFERLENDEEREREKEFLKRTLRQLNANERIIRRYRVQDIIIFLMAKSILFSNEAEFGNNFQHFRLKDIRPIGHKEGKSALELAIPFSITLRVKGCDAPVVIHQQAIKIKNYGDFYRFLHDSRLATLIPYLVEDDKAVTIKIERGDLEREFERYDRERHQVFANVHRIEQMILETHQALTDRTSEDYYYDDGSGQLKPLRTNFSRLLSYAHVLTQDQEDEAVNIRNSFAHNAYMGEGKGKVRISTNTIGDIASAISRKMQDKTENINKEQ